MIVDGTKISIELLKAGTRRLSVLGRPLGVAVLFTQTQWAQFHTARENAMKRTHYETLGVAPTASDAEIQAAYRTRAKEIHPDVSEVDSHTEMTNVNVAHQVLSDPEQRKLYDQLMKGV